MVLKTSITVNLLHKFIFHKGLKDVTICPCKRNIKNVNTYANDNVHRIVEHDFGLKE
jgi:hypothetical protein